MTHQRIAVVLCGALLSGLSGAASAQGIEVTRPIAHAIVRETVPIKISPRDLPPGGYVAITIDGLFRTAKTVAKGNQPIYLWDTKASYTTPDDPDTSKFVPDGPHTISIAVYDSSNKLVGSEAVPVRVANKIHMSPSQGVKLTYHWRLDESLHYQRHTELNLVGNTSQNGGPAQPDQNIQLSQIKFSRTVEDANEGSYLLRDKVLPNGWVVNRNQPQLVQSAYLIKSKYRTVNDYGEVLDTMAPLTQGEHFDFSIPELPTRRVGVGDSWQSQVQIALEWASSKPATVTAESRLEDFEWQNGYPTAKIRETYTGPAHFATGTDTTLPPISAQTVKFERILYFAYNSGRLVKTDTTMDVTASLSSAQLGALGGSGGGFPGGGFGGRGGFSGGAGGFPGAGKGEGGFSGGGFPGGSSLPGGFGGYPGGAPGGFPGGPPGGFGGYPGGGFPGAGGFPGGGAPGGFGGGAKAVTELKASENSILLPS